MNISPEVSHSLLKQGNESFVVQGGEDTVWKVAKSLEEHKSPLDTGLRLMLTRSLLTKYVLPAIQKLKQVGVEVPDIKQSVLLGNNRFALELQKIPGYTLEDNTPEAEAYKHQWSKDITEEMLVKAFEDCAKIAQAGLSPDINQGNTMLTYIDGKAGIAFLDTYYPLPPALNDTSTVL